MTAALDPTSTTPAAPSAQLTRVLTDSVRRATGLATAEPRPGQLLAAQDIYVAMTSDVPGHVSANCPTGVGKSLAVLSTSMLRAAVAGERTVIATQSLGLQGQYLDKDAPPVAAAVAAETGSHIKVALLKGWSNFACAEQALTTAAAVLGQEISTLTKLGPAKVADLLDAKAKPTGLGSAGATTLIDRQPLSTVELARAAAWALRQSLGAGTGDKDKYPHAVGYEVWAAVSTTPAECLGADACPLIDICRPTAARTAAAEADILVTNHAMLGVQAAVNAPIVVGSKRLGHIDHIIVDEAHALPGIVRSQGAKELSGRRIRSVVGTLGGCLTEFDPPVARMLANGLTIADAVDAELARFVREAETSEPVATITAVGDPLEDTGPMLSGWLDDARTMLKQMLDRSSGGPASLRRSRRATDRLSGLTADLAAIRVHRDGIARWVDRGETRPGQRPQSPAGKASPVDVAPMLIGALWTAVDNRSSDDDPADQLSFRLAGEDGPGGEDEGSTVAAPALKYPLSVTCLSATLPAGFCGDTGLKAGTRHYPSPFDDAYGRSALFVPRATDPADVEALSARRGHRKPQLDVKAHPRWAMKHIAKLIAANRGRALILSATSDAGKFYAAELRKISGGRWNVYSQWDGRSTTQLLAAWKADTHSVMVGTKSLMTGVDAPGQTCSLVILDRVPRAPSNPVDDARVKLLTERLNSKWQADSQVYAGDAALLLEQAAGRLIRCFDLDTEILTTQGWKQYSQVTAGDTVYGIPPESLTSGARSGFRPSENGAPILAQHRVLHVKINEDPEPMVRIKAKSLDCVVTPDHTMIVQPSVVNVNMAGHRNSMYTWKGGDYLRVPASDVPARFRVPLAGRVSRQPTKLHKDWFRLIGLISTDGSFHQNKNSITIHQSVTKPLVVDEVDRLLAALAISRNRYIVAKDGTAMNVRGGKAYTRNGDMVLWQINGSDASRIKDVFFRGSRRRYSERFAYRKASHQGVLGWQDISKRIPRWCLNRASRPQLLALLDGLMLGDGGIRWVTNGRRSGTFYTGIKAEADSFQELLALIGYRSSLNSRSATQFDVSFSARGSVDVTRSACVTVAEDAATWCVNTELGSVLVRRGGHTFISGNSGTDFGMVAVLDPRLLKPAGSVFNYAASSRNLLKAALKRFDRKMSLIEDAVAFLCEPQLAAG